MRRHHLPNLITGLRLLLVPVILWFLIAGRHAEALVLVCIAGLSDGADGFLAKRYGWQTRLGAILDPLADKALLMGTFVVLGVQGFLPLWLVVLALLRDMLILAGALSYQLWIQELKIQPSLLSKANTLAQILLLTVILLKLSLGASWPLLSQALMGLVTVTILASGIHYVATWSHKAMKNRRKHPE